MADKLAYTIEEVAGVTGICRSRLYLEISAGRLRMVKCGRRSTVLADDLKAWLVTLPAPSAKSAA